MNAITMLTDDHRKVESLFVQYEGESDLVTRRRLAERILVQLAMHARLEEDHFYPAARGATPGAEKLTADSYEDHAKMAMAIGRIEGMRSPDGGHAQAMRELRALVESHVELEEGELFPKVSEALGTGRLEEIGSAMEEARRASMTQG